MPFSFESYEKSGLDCVNKVMIVKKIEIEIKVNKLLMDEKKNEKKKKKL